MPTTAQAIDDAAAFWFNDHTGALADLPEAQQRAMCSAIRRAWGAWRGSAGTDQIRWAEQRRDAFDALAAAHRLSGLLSLFAARQSPGCQRHVAARSGGSAMVIASENFPGPNPDTRDMTGLTDAEALRQSLAEPSRFAVIYERHLSRVHQYVGRRAGFVHAEDLTADVFVRAFRCRNRYTVQYANALPWLMGIATNVIGDHRRLERRSLAALERLSRERPQGTEGLDIQLGSELLRALTKLRHEDRDALLLVVWGELSYEEAAQALGIPIGTLRSRTARARRRLADDMDPAVTFTAVEARGGQRHA